VLRDALLSNSYSYSNGDSYAYTYPNGHAHSYGYSHSYGDSYLNADRNRDAHA
jgi:hypothetical protein